MVIGWINVVNNIQPCRYSTNGIQRWSIVVMLYGMEYMNELPFYSTSSNDLDELYKNKIQKTNAFECNNNDFFAEIYPDLNFINQTNKNASYYTIKEFQKEYYKNKERKNNLSLFHTNIKNSPHKKNDLKCYLSTIGVEFSIIWPTENWRKQYNIDLRYLSGYKHHYFK